MVDRSGSRKPISFLGVPLGYGASMAGVDMGPAALRVARLKQRSKTKERIAHQVDAVISPLTDIDTVAVILSSVGIETS